MERTVRVAELLKLLRAWGWEAGRERMLAHIEALPDARERAMTRVFHAFQCAGRGDEADATDLFRVAADEHEAVRPWSLCGLGFVAMRGGRYDEALSLLDRAEALAAEPDPEFLGVLANVRAATRYHRGDPFEEVLLLCERAVGHLGLDRFVSGRVLDTLGMLYTSRGSRQSAQLFFRRALETKRRNEDVAGQAITLGNLGRLELSWGDLDAAEAYFREDREISERIGDARGVAQMCGHLGRVECLRGRFAEALEWLDLAVRASEGRWPGLEGFARKDRAFALLGAGRLDEAAADLDRAGALLTTNEGRAHVDSVRGALERRRGEFAAAERNLRSALTAFESIDEPADAAECCLELARTRRAAAAPRGLVLQTLDQAFALAARSRRDGICARIEAEMRDADPVAWARHLYRRVRGRDLDADTTSLVAQERQDLTALFLDIEGSTELGRTLDPEAVLATVNELMAHFGVVLGRHGLAVSGFLGDGFLALATGPDHAVHAVDAALGLFAALEEFNRPRRLLGVDPIRIRVGCNSGPAVVGNLGTHRKMDRTAIGHIVNLAKRVESHGTSERPAVGPGTWPLVSRRYEAVDPEGRAAAFKGCAPGEGRVWDVVGPRPGTDARA